MKKSLTVLLFLVATLLSPLSQVEASDERQSISELPFSGYYITTSEHAIDGLLFEDNQLYIYISEDSHAEGIEGHDWVHFLEEFHSFPHPDLMSYTGSVRERYLEEYDLAYDLQDEYLEIAELITPEMGQLDIQNLINNRIPGIYYTEKNHYQYYIIASPTVTNEGDEWRINLFGEDLYTFTLEEDGVIIEDQDGVEYEFVSGIKP